MTPNNKIKNNKRKEARERNIEGESFSENQLKKILSYPKFDPKGFWKKHFAKPKPISVDEFDLNYDDVDWIGGGNTFKKVMRLETRTPYYVNAKMLDGCNYVWYFADSETAKGFLRRS